MYSPEIRANAIAEGYTLFLIIITPANGEELAIYVRPDAELDERFLAVDAHDGQYIRVNGWMISIDHSEDLAA